MSEFYNDITILSSGYDFYLNTGFIPVEATIQVQTDVSSDAQIDAIIEVQSDVVSIANFDVYLESIISADIVVSVVTEVISIASIVYDASASIDCKFDVNLFSIERFSPSIIEDSFNIKPFFYLDNIPLSEHNRTSSSAIQMVNIVNSNWRGRKSAYYKNKSNKKTFSFQWTFLPGKRANTVDNNAGRDIINMASKDAGLHKLEVRNLDTNGLIPYTVEVYNVLVTEYNESLVRRDLVGDDYYWDCVLNLQEA